MQQDLSSHRLESSHKFLVIDYVHGHLDNLCHIEEKDQVLAAFKQNLASVAGPLDVWLKFQVDCPDCYRQHKADKADRSCTATLSHKRACAELIMVSLVIVCRQ